MVGDKATPYCVAAHIIFVYGERGDSIVWVCVYVIVYKDEY